MSDPRIDNVRTLALTGHGGAGKTTLIEAMLARAGAIAVPGRIEQGNTVCDYDPLEKAHLHSVKLALAHFERNGVRVHLVDTPGYPDFMGQALCALDAVDTVAVVIDAQKGIEYTAQRMMHWAETRKLDRMLIVNKIDLPSLDFAALLAEIQAVFGRECLPVNLPAKGGARVVDCYFNPGQDDEKTDFSSIREAHRALIEQVVEVDEAVMSRYLEEGDIPAEALRAPLEKALREGHLVPVCFVSAHSGAGVGELLDLIERLLPHPGEGNWPLFVRGEGESATPFRAEPDPDRHVLAHVFKVEIDPYIGRICALRVHQGTLKPASQLYVGENRKPFKVAHLYRLQGKQLCEIDAAYPGDLCALTKLDEIGFDAVLHDAPEDGGIRMQPLDFPHAVYGLAVRPKKTSDAGKLGEVLHRLAAEDPALVVEHDPATHEAVLRGLGEMHLAHVLEKMREQFRLEVETHPPSIPYRETILVPAEGHYRHKKQTGGAGQFGEVFLRVEPLERGAGFKFVDAVKGGVIPAAFIPAVEKGVREAMAQGAAAGFPMQDIRVTVYDGKTHPVDGKEIAFFTAGKKAFQEAMRSARPIVLEPIVRVELTLPESAFGDVSGELSARRAQITGSQTGRGGMMRLEALAPLAELGDLQSRIKALTGGQGAYTLELVRYDPAPPEVQRRLAERYRPGEDEP